MVEVVGSVGSRAGPPWSSPGSPATRVWREEDGGLGLRMQEEKKQGRG